MSIFKDTTTTPIQVYALDAALSPISDVEVRENMFQWWFWKVDYGFWKQYFHQASRETCMDPDTTSDHWFYEFVLGEALEEIRKCQQD